MIVDQRAHRRGGSSAKQGITPCVTNPPGNGQVTQIGGSRFGILESATAGAVGEHHVTEPNGNE